jgi:D-3-phosphoglycerate dehydrogenase
MGKATVLVSDDRFGGDYTVEREILATIDAELVLPHDDSETAFLENARTADALLVNLRPIDGRTVGLLENCRIVSRYGVGYDNVDVPALTSAGIWLANVPDYSVEEVSDQALALLLACARLVVVKDQAIRSGKWNYFGGQRVRRIKGSTLGLIGFGNIARRFHQKTSGFSFKEVLVYDPYLDARTIEGYGAVKCELGEVVARADFLSIHAPLTPATRHLIGKAQIALMKTDAILVNTARGPVVDEAALATALADGRLRAAGLDVFENEPLPADSPLRTLANVVLSDHCSYYSEEAIRELKAKAAQNIVAVLTGGRPTYPVNRDVVPRGR